VFRLHTVRAKLTSLVLLSVLTALLVLPVISWQTKKQLTAEIDDRVEGVRSSFQVELNDDLLDVSVASKLIPSAGRARKAIQTRDAAMATDAGKHFHEAYPDIDTLFADSAGKVFAGVGNIHPHDDLKSIPEFLPAFNGGQFRGMLPTGCEKKGDKDIPAFAMAVPVEGGGVLALCLPMDNEYMHNASAKLGLELALVAKGSSEIITRSDNFPANGATAMTAVPLMVDHGDATWAAARFTPKEFDTGRQTYEIVAALDVSDVRAIVRRNFAIALGIILVSAAFSLAWGTRLAGIMSRALTSMNNALTKLSHQEYVKVTNVNTGDELENLAIGFNQMVDGLQERDKLRTTFGKYMTEAVMDHLMAGRVELGGQTLKVTILFTDIRSFTSISEKMEAHALVALLNEYFTDMVAAIMEEDGVVDKYIGDAIMAVFGAPVQRNQDSLHAVRAAVHMRVALSKLNERLRERGLPAIRTGIGIHTGDVVAGNIGSEKRMEYTVIGDAVNLASRLESSTKEVGVDILISEDTYEEVKEYIDARPVRELTVKGREKPVMTYEVLGIKGGAVLPMNVASLAPKG
jgi:adenylate cyclase